jgi:hypothetical protein
MTNPQRRSRGWATRDLLVVGAVSAATGVLLIPVSLAESAAAAAGPLSSAFLSGLFAIGRYRRFGPLIVAGAAPAAFAALVVGSVWMPFGLSDLTTGAIVAFIGIALASAVAAGAAAAGIGRALARTGVVRHLRHTGPHQLEARIILEERT